jgi:hypothetical protein
MAGQRDAIIDFQAGKGFFVGEGPKPAPIRLPGTPFMHRGVLMVPLRSMLANRDLDWNESARTVHIHRNKQWLRFRLKDNKDYIKNHGGYEYLTPI